MCPLCITNAALVVAGATSGAGVLGLVAVKVRAMRRRRREPRIAPRDSHKINESTVSSASARQ
jgi:hypothetical protein